MSWSLREISGNLNLRRTLRQLRGADAKPVSRTQAMTQAVRQYSLWGGSVAAGGGFFMRAVRDALPLLHVAVPLPGGGDRGGVEDGACVRVRRSGAPCVNGDFVADYSKAMGWRVAASSVDCSLQAVQCMLLGMGAGALVGVAVGASRAVCFVPPQRAVDGAHDD